MSHFINRTFKYFTESASFPNLKFHIPLLPISLPQIKWRREGEPTKVTYNASVKNGNTNPIPKIIMAQLDKTH